MKRVPGTVSPQMSAAAATAGAPSATANPTTTIRIERAPLMPRPAAHFNTAVVCQDARVVSAHG